MASAMIEVCEPAYIAKFDESGVLVINAFRKLPTAACGNAEVRVPIGESRPKPQPCVFDKREYFLVGNGVLWSNNDEIFTMVYELGYILPKEGEGWVGDDDVRLLEQLDALGAAEVAASRERLSAVGVSLQEKFDILDAGRTISVDILYLLDLDGNRLRLVALATALVVLTECELCAGDGGAIVAGGDEFFEAELVEVGGEILEEVALEGVVAVAVDNLAAECVGVEL